jgi:hypothetical protein
MQVVKSAVDCVEICIKYSIIIEELLPNKKLLKLYTNGAYLLLNS